jgi:methionyl-tRNA formyltransferase
LHKAGFTPSLIVCNPDRPVGRKQILTPPPVKVWAEAHDIRVLQPASLKDEAAKHTLAEAAADLFVVVAYNAILPTAVLALPPKGVLNLHPSLLPKLRGASPIRTAIKDDLPETIGVTVMLMDEQMDHGPILAQAVHDLSDTSWPLPGPELDARLAAQGGALLAETIPAWLAGTLTPTPQNHDEATYCGKFTKADGELAIDPHHLPRGEAARAMWRIVCALTGIGGTFFMHQGKRVKITEAAWREDTLVPLRVIPENQREMAFAEYLSSLA